MKAPGETAQRQGHGRLRRRQTRATSPREATVESNMPDVATVDATPTVKGARIGEATLLVRYQGKFSTMPVTVLNPKPGFAWKPLPQNNYIDRADRRQAAAAEDPAVARGGRRRFPAPRLARSHRPAADARGGARVPGRPDAVHDQARDADRQADRQPGVRRSLDREVGRPAAKQPQVPRREGRVRVPRVDPRIDRAEQALRQHGARAADRARQLLRRIRRPISSASRASPSRRWRRPRRSSSACAWCARSATTIPSSAGRRISITRWRRSSRPSACGRATKWARRSSTTSAQDYEMKHPKDGRVMKPKFIIAGHRRRVPVPTRSAPARRTGRLADLARTIRSSPNPSPTACGATSSGTGIIDPVDDIRASNPPVNPALLDALTKDFMDHNFDLRHLMRTIANSRAYQASIATNEWNAERRRQLLARHSAAAERGGS